MKFVTLVAFYPSIRYGALPAALPGSPRIAVRRVLRGADPLAVPQSTRACEAAAELPGVSSLEQK